MITAITGRIQLIQGATIFSALAIAFVFIALAFVITILSSRVINTHRSGKRRRICEQLQKTINAVIMLEHSDENDTRFSLAFYLNELRPKIRSSFAKQLLIDLLIANKQNLSGGSASTLKKVYERLRLSRFSRSKLKSGSRIRKIQGLQELAEMECVDSLPNVERLLRHKNAMIRQESFIATIRLAGTPFFLADRYVGPITPWMQLTIHKHLAKLPTDQLPKFYDWFNYKNNEIRKFAIIMTSLFRPPKAIPHLAMLLEDRDPEIAGLAAETLGGMGAVDYADAIAKLGRCYPMNDALQLKVIHALKEIGNGREHGAQLAWQMIHGTYAVRFEAMRAMQRLKLYCKDFLIDYNITNDGAFEEIYAHITERLLQS
jgi:hypothetical protein